jgi:hypothetical protein
LWARGEQSGQRNGWRQVLLDAGDHLVNRRQRFVVDFTPQSAERLQRIESRCFAFSANVTCWPSAWGRISSCLVAAYCAGFDQSIAPPITEIEIAKTGGVIDDIKIIKMASEIISSGECGYLR